MSKVVCPYCFEKFEKKETMFRCTNYSGCTSEKDTVLNKFWGWPDTKLSGTLIQNTSFSIGKLFGGAPDHGVCPKCHNDAFEMACPHCHNVIPREMVKEGGRIISIIGARSSGKTNYIATLINELKKHNYQLGDLGVLGSAAANESKNSTEKRYERDFYNILYKNGKCPPPTDINDPNNRIPLIYKVSQGKQSIHLVLYDTAGENFNEMDNIAKNVKFINESDGIIFLLDTFSVDHVHDKLQSALGLNRKIELKYDAILSNIISHFSNRVSEDQKKDHFKKPIALAFSKIDAVVNHPEIFEDTSIPNLSMQRNSSFIDGGGVSLSEIDSISDGMKGALMAWGESNFVSIMKSYKNHKYFGISSLGGEPDANNNIAKIRPYRVLDPLVWMLNEFNFKLPLAK